MRSRQERSMSLMSGSSSAAGSASMSIRRMEKTLMA
jgi:hypothetical protein